MQGPPFPREVLDAAVAMADESGNLQPLHDMLQRIQEKRSVLTDQLASLRVQELLSTMSALLSLCVPYPALLPHLTCT
jgi:hypothetical protein